MSNLVDEKVVNDGASVEQQNVVASAPKVEPKLTELIATRKSQKWIDSNGNEISSIIVLTVKGKEVWCNEHQIKPDSETVSFQWRPKGTEYIDRNGDQAFTVEGRYNYLGCGMQVIKQYDAVELFAKKIAILVESGITPNFTM